MGSTLHAHDRLLDWLENHPGVRPKRVGYTWRRIMEKCIFNVARQKAKEACGTEQFCRGM